MNNSARRRFRLLYIAGPGDIIGTYDHWRRGEADPSQVAWTYSGQFFDVCRQLNAKALVIASHNDKRVLVDGDFHLRHEPPLSRRLRGVSYHLAEIGRCLRLSLRALRYRADVVVIAEGNHWFAWTPLAWLGVKSVASLHCAMWPAGHRPQGRIARLLQTLNGRFWRGHVLGTLCVSPECEHQVRKIAGSLSRPMLQVRAQYDRETFAEVRPPPAERKPFRILYAGRIEPEKGVFDLLEAAQILKSRKPGHFVWEFCGGGSALKQLGEEVVARGLDKCVQVCGPLTRTDMTKAYGRSHMVAVPTTSRFAEGLNKVVVEAVLAGRPVVTTRLAHAEGVLDDVLLLAESDNPESFASHIQRLAEDDKLYQNIRDKMPDVTEQFYDRSLSWGNALKKVLNDEVMS